MKRVLSILLMAASGPLALGVVDQTDIAALKQKASAGDPAAQVQVGMSYALSMPRDSKGHQMVPDGGGSRLRRR